MMVGTLFFLSLPRGFESTFIVFFPDPNTIVSVQAAEVRDVPEPV